MQGYFRSPKTQYLDLTWTGPGGAPGMARFVASRGELGWVHPEWAWDGEAFICVPTATVVRAQNRDVRVELRAETGGARFPIMSNATVGVQLYVYHYRWVRGLQGGDGSGPLLAASWLCSETGRAALCRLHPHAAAPPPAPFPLPPPASAPRFTGRITDRASGALVVDFEGGGGHEWARPKELWAAAKGGAMTPEACRARDGGTYAHAMPF
jgi:hypothetical protein